jgi:hypothetical protein
VALTIFGVDGEASLSHSASERLEITTLAPGRGTHTTGQASVPGT